MTGSESMMNTEMGPMDALDSGIEALGGESVMQASEVLVYLQTHPEFFSEHADSLAQLSLPTKKDGNVISMANWQARVLRDKADQHQVRLEQLLVQATNNQRNHDKLFTLVSGWLSALSAQELPELITEDLRSHFALDAVHIMLWDERARTVLYPAASKWSDSVVVFANSLRTPYCGPCKGFEIEQILAQKSSTGQIASLTIIPLWGSKDGRVQCIGVLLFGADDAQRFTPDMGTHFLQYIGVMAGSALSRVREPIAS